MPYHISTELEQCQHLNKENNFPRIFTPSLITSRLSMLTGGSLILGLKAGSRTLRARQATTPEPRDRSVERIRSRRKEVPALLEPRSFTKSWNGTFVMRGTHVHPCLTPVR